jgi:hypothetical protein
MNTGRTGALVQSGRLKWVIEDQMANYPLFPKCIRLKKLISKQEAGLIQRRRFFGIKAALAKNRV